MPVSTMAIHTLVAGLAKAGSLGKVLQQPGRLALGAGDVPTRLAAVTTQAGRTHWLLKSQNRQRHSLPGGFVYEIQYIKYHVAAFASATALPSPAAMRILALHLSAGVAQW